jgi:N-acetylglucosaminyldiphosphoundecaprenol N-acetyl-beta-D-mannosaminyltransferase
MSLSRAIITMRHELNIPRVSVGGLPLAVIDRRDSAELMVSAALARRGSGTPPLIMTSANGQVISMCARDAELRSLFLAADLIHADGTPLVFASRLKCDTPLPERVVGVRHGYFAAGEQARVADEINAAAPDILWIGMGVPNEQVFSFAHRARLTKVGLIKTSGGLFDFLSGRNGRAPQWMQSAGLEWLYRLSLEPRRLFFRYLRTNPHALYLLLKDRPQAWTAASIPPAKEHP